MSLLGWLLVLLLLRILLRILLLLLLRLLRLLLLLLRLLLLLLGRLLRLLGRLLRLLLRRGFLAVVYHGCADIGNVAVGQQDLIPFVALVVLDSVQNGDRIALVQGTDNVVAFCGGGVAQVYAVGLDRCRQGGKGCAHHDDQSHQKSDQNLSVLSVFHCVLHSLLIKKLYTTEYTRNHYTA